MTVLVSVITVSHNSARTIEDTLNSVDAQTYPDIEHVIVDGASRDETLKLIQTRKASNRRVISEPDHGIYDAMNKGMRLASGDMVGFLNADDVFASTGAVASLVAEFERSRADAVYGDLVYVPPDDLGRVVRYWRSGHFHRSRLRFGWMPPHPTFYVRRTILAELGEFDTTLNVSADYDFMLRCLRREGCSVSYLQEILVRMRLGGESNRSIQSVLRKSWEDLGVLRRNNAGGVATLMCKNMRKIPQFFARPEEK